MRSKPPPRQTWRRRPSPLLTLRRHPRLWWALTVVLALGVGTATAAAVGRAEEVRASWGQTDTVLVAVRDLPAGHAVEPGDVVARERPRALVPAGALQVLPEAAVTAAAVVEGEVVVAERLAGAGLRGPAALLPAGWRAMAIPAEPGLVPPVSVGDHVDVLVAVAAEEAGGGPPGFTLVAGALVVAVDDDAVTVGVPGDAAPRVAVALAAGAVSLALVGA